MAPLILMLFLFLSLIIILAWTGFRRLSIGLFIIFLLATVLVLFHHMTDALSLNF